MSIYSRNTIAEWTAIAHWCDMEAEEKGVAGPKTKAAERAFWAIRNPEVLVPVEVALAAIEPVAEPVAEPEPAANPFSVGATASNVTPAGRKPQPLITAPLPIKATKPAKMTVEDMPVKKLSFGTNNARARMAAMKATSKALPPRINYAGVEDWADEKATADVTQYDGNF